MKKIQLIENIVGFSFNEFGKLVVKKSDNSVYCGDLKFNFKGKSYSILANKCIWVVYQMYC